MYIHYARLFGDLKPCSYNLAQFCNEGRYLLSYHKNCAEPNSITFPACNQSGISKILLFKYVLVTSIDCERHLPFGLGGLRSECYEEGDNRVF